MPFDIDNRDSDYRRPSPTAVENADTPVPGPLRRTFVTALDRTFPGRFILARIVGLRRDGRVVCERDCAKWCGIESQGENEGEHSK
jgi:hypothetical protein